MHPDALIVTAGPNGERWRCQITWVDQCAACLEFNRVRRPRGSRSGLTAGTFTADGLLVRPHPEDSHLAVRAADGTLATLDQTRHLLTEAFAAVVPSAPSPHAAAMQRLLHVYAMPDPDARSVALALIAAGHTDTTTADLDAAIAAALTGPPRNC